MAMRRHNIKYVQKCLTCAIVLNILIPILSVLETHEFPWFSPLSAFIIMFCVMIKVTNRVW